MSAGMSVRNAITKLEVRVSLVKVENAFGISVCENQEI